MRAPHRASGFTLLELVIGTTMSLAIAGVAMGTLVTVQATQRESMLKNATTRDGMYMLDMVGGDLGYAGVGIPWGNEVDGLAGRMRPVIRVGGAKQLAFIGDLPLPNSDFNGLTSLAALDGTAAQSADVAVTSEIALCAPSLGGASYSCDTTKNTLVNQGSGAVDCSTNVTATTCPWSLGKWAAIPSASASLGPGQLLLFSAPTGQWAWRRVAIDAATGRPAPTVDVNGMLGVPLTDDFPTSTGDLIDRRTFAAAAIGATVVATVDRVYYSVEKLGGGTCTDTDRQCVLRRRHCWGEVLDVNSPSFPAAGSAPLLAPDTPAGCSAPDEGTSWEPVANNLDGLTFHYFTRDDVELTPPLSAADLERVASIGVVLVIARAVPGTETTLRHRVERRFFLDAGDGYGPNGRR